MKLSDFGLAFAIIFLCMMVVFDFRLETMRQIQRQNVIYNNIIDTAAEDALRNSLSYDEEKEKVCIDSGRIFGQFFKSLQEIIDVDIYDFPVFIVTNPFGFKIWDNGVCREVQYESELHREKIDMIKKAAEDAINSSAAAKLRGYRYSVDIPYEEINEWCNTVSDLSLIAIFEGRIVGRDNMYERYIISGASFRYEGVR